MSDPKEVTPRITAKDLADFRVVISLLKHSDDPEYRAAGNNYKRLLAEVGHLDHALIAVLHAVVEASGHLELAGTTESASDAEDHVMLAGQVLTKAFDEARFDFNVVTQRRTGGVSRGTVERE